jgi:predicted TIM-barrel fold metal-dependent hydrolase
MAANTQITPRRSLDPPIRHDWLSKWSEEILLPNLPIVDPHHHLWDVPDWDSRYFLDELLADTNSGHNIVATVFLQCWSMHRASGPDEMKPVGETEFVNGIAAQAASRNYGATNVCAGIVGHANLKLGVRVREVLEAHIRAGGGRFRGIRDANAWDASVPASSEVRPGLLGDPSFREGFAQLAPLDLSFDAWMYHPQVPELTALARVFPETRIVLNHIGAPLGVGPYAGRRDEVFAAWSMSLRELATCPNVHVKVGGMGMPRYGHAHHDLPTPPSSRVLADAWRPYVETCIEAFGANRCMFESNFPVDKVSYPYAAYWNACKVLTSGASAADRAALLHDTAARFYRLS